MAVTFTGTSYYSTTNVPSLQMDTCDVTFACWVYVTSISTIGGGTPVAAAGDTFLFVGVAGSSVTSGEYADWLNISTYNGSSPAGDFYLEHSVNFYTQEAYSEDSQIPLNTWTHLAGTRSSSNVRALYMNGVSQSFTNGGPGVTTSIAWDRLVVGGFVGDMQDAIVFNRVLSAAEIGDLYRGRMPAMSRSNLVAHWPLLGGGNSGIDISGNGRHLTASGTVVDATRQAPTSWNTRTPTLYSRTSGTTQNVVPSGTTNSTGAVSSTTVTMTAIGTTQTTGAATVSPRAPAVGTTNATAAATVSPSAPATGSVQTTGAVVASPSAPAAGQTQSTGSATASPAGSAAGTTQATGAATASPAGAATGTTQTTGSAAETFTQAMSAAGTTQTTGAVTASPVAPASGQTQTTGAATASPSAPASGTTQTTGAAAMSNGSSGTLVPDGETQVTGSATVAINYAQTAAGTTNTTGAAVIALNFAAVPSGSTQTTGAATVSFAQVIPITAAGTTNTTGASSSPARTFATAASGQTQSTGAAVMTFAQVFQMTAAGSTVCFGSAAMSGPPGPSSGAGDGAQTGTLRRFADVGGMRRRLRR